ncbi:MAG TPA: glycosyltransferase family 2 protein [Vicinamibacterales bacterium]|nr:glycosyltransferase family 2 protein [Vicinamibacterales bacterium]
MALSFKSSGGIRCVTLMGTRQQDGNYPYTSGPGRSFRISILIVNYRSYPEIASCLESLRPFLVGDVEVIVVDHESEPAAAAELVRRFPWMRLIAVDGNPGFAAGVNRGARAATGDYLLLMNPDCSMNGDVAHTLAGWMEAHPRVGVSGALVYEADGSVQASARRFPDATTGVAGRTSWLSRLWPDNALTRRNLTTPSKAGDPVTVDWVSGACMMVRRRAFDEASGMDEGFFLYWEDADLCRRLSEKGWTTVYNAAVAVTHLTSRSSRRAPARSLVAFHRSAFRYFVKHGGTGARLAAPLVYVALSARLLVKLAVVGVTRLFTAQP